MPRGEATKDDVRAVSIEHDAATARPAAPQPAAAAAALADYYPCRGDRGAADWLERTVVLCRLDRQRSIGGLDKPRGCARPRLRLRLAIGRRLSVRDRNPLRQSGCRV